MKKIILIIAILFITGVLYPGNVSSTELTGVKDPFTEKMFHNETGFVGGDAVYSIYLGHNKILWLFGDSFIGSIKNNKRRSCAFINNSIAISRGKNSRTGFERIKHYWNIKNCRPQSFFQPVNEKRWFWPLDGVKIKDTLYIFFQEIVKTKENDVFGFKTSGNYIAVIKNPHKNPRFWDISYVKIPFFNKYELGILTLGNSVLKTNKLYIYGVYQPDKNDASKKQMIVVQMNPYDILNFKKWNIDTSMNLVPGAAMEFTVRRIKRKKYLLTYTKNEISKNVWCAEASRPQGPLSKPQPVYDCEYDSSKEQFPYAAKCHPQYQNDNGILLTYMVNTFRFTDLINDAELYFPRTVRLKIK